MRKYQLIETCDPKELCGQIEQHEANGWHLLSESLTMAVDPGSKFPMTYAVLMVRYEQPAMTLNEALSVPLDDLEQEIPAQKFAHVTAVYPIGRIAPAFLMGGWIR